MTIEDFDVQPLFATPYFRTSIAHAMDSDQVAFIKNLKMVRNRDNLISENLYIFNEPELKKLSDVVQEALDVYADKVMGISQKLYVTQSWALINEPNVGMHAHAHSNSIISGSLYYCDLPTPLSNVVFDKHTSYRQITLNPDRERQNVFNTPINVITPQTHDLIMFSSDLNHQIEANQSSEPRHAIAFNTFVKGKLGSFRDVSELSL